MRKFIFLLLFIPNMAFAQRAYWSPVQIPIDFLNPASLTFVDSLHGYFGAFKARNESIIWRDFQFFWFSTTDGGISWNRVIHKINDSTILPDSGGVGVSITDFNSNILYPSISHQYIDGSDSSKREFLTLTTDGGKSWQSEPSPPLLFFSAFSENHLLGYNDRKKTLYQSYDFGKTFTLIPPDSSYLSIAYPPSSVDSADIFSPTFDFSDSTIWTIAWSYAFSEHKGLMPPGLHTLISTNSGISWQSYTSFSDTSGSFAGTLQYIRGTPNVYYFTGQPQGAGFRSSNTTSVWGDNANPILGISYLSSSDYGKTWTTQNKYGAERKAFRVVQKDEVWITAASKPVAWDFSTPAYKICHTTDNGLSWEEDSLTLQIETNKLDGRIMTFSDPRHGWIAASDWPKTYIYRYNQEINSVPALKQIDGLRIYPNPANMDANVELPHLESGSRIEIYNILGNRVKMLTQINNDFVKIDVHDLPAGSYILRLTNSSTSISQPFLVEH
jgi:hypothetical protein